MSGDVDDLCENGQNIEFNESVHDQYEYEQNESKIVSGKSRLRDHIEFWKSNLFANEFILNTLQFGYIIPFENVPPGGYLKNKRSSLVHSKFVKSAILELLQAKCVTEVEMPYIVNPLDRIGYSSGKKRLVLDLRHVNKYVIKQKVKFEGVKEALSYAHKDLCMIKFDLKSGYHHIDIHDSFQKYLDFSWDFDGVTRYFTFTVLPFGLSSAGHISTKVVRVLVNYWRTRAIPVVVYLDDGWVCQKYEKCVKTATLVRESLHNAGFLVNEEKSQFIPSKKMKWLGFVWNLEKGTLDIPDDKVKVILSMIRSVLDGIKITNARKLASIVGKIISLKPALGNISQLMTRKTCMSICCRKI